MVGSSFCFGGGLRVDLPSAEFLRGRLPAQRYLQLLLAQSARNVRTWSRLPENRSRTSSFKRVSGFKEWRRPSPSTSKAPSEAPRWAAPVLLFKRTARRYFLPG